MALTKRTVTEALNLAIAFQTPASADPTVTAAERAQIGQNLQRCTAVLADVDPVTNIVPENRRQGDASALFDRVFATTGISDKYWATRPAVLYDALDLMFDIAEAVLKALPTITSDLSVEHP